MSCEDPRSKKGQTETVLSVISCYSRPSLMLNEYHMQTWCRQGEKQIQSQALTWWFLLRISHKQIWKIPIVVVWGKRICCFHFLAFSAVAKHNCMVESDSPPLTSFVDRFSAWITEEFPSKACCCRVCILRQSQAGFPSTAPELLMSVGRGDRWRSEG